jgi:hypothetical protein
MIFRGSVFYTPLLFSSSEAEKGLAKGALPPFTYIIGPRTMAQMIARPR